MMRENQLAFLQENCFSHTGVLPWEKMPPPDEVFLEAWEDYCQEAVSQGAFAVLRRRLVQFHFPVQKGLSENKNYQLATKRGTDTGQMKEATGTELKAPAELYLYLYPTLAGRIPVIQTGNRADFETLVRVLACRNEPVSVPPSMGACLVKGYNNWDRVKKYRADWEKSIGNKDNLDILWRLEFQRLKSSPELYQDRFLILTDSGYSNVTAGMLGLPENEWRRLSLVIRREHEATHYFTLRFLGSARNHLLDEFIADYMGLVAACGRYRADWFLSFLGLENYPAYRQGGRLGNYLKDSDLAGETFAVVKQLVKDAAVNIENFSNKYADKIYSSAGKYRMLLAMSKMNLLMLASGGAEQKLLENGLQDFLTQPGR